MISAVTTYADLVTDVSVEDLITVMQEVEAQGPDTLATVVDTADLRMQVDGLTASELVDLLLKEIAYRDIYEAPLRGWDIEGMRRVDWLDQSLTDGEIEFRALNRHLVIDTDAVIDGMEGAVPDVETVGDWIDAVADRVAAEAAR
jgi:hypothetical protein